MRTPPRWARSSACADSTACEPRNADEYAAWAGATVAHFKGRVSHWEVWNEPNIPNFWKPQPNVARYTALLRAAYPQIKAADPSAVVLAGATSPAGNDGVRIDEVSFLQGVYANGDRAFRRVEPSPVHAPWPPGNVHADSAWYQMYGTTPSMRSLMQAAGDGQKQLWATEYGPPTAGGPGAVSETTQAQHVTDAYRLWRSVLLGRPALLVLRPRRRGSGNVDGGLALPRPAPLRLLAEAGLERLPGLGYRRLENAKSRSFAANVRS